MVARQYVLLTQVHHCRAREAYTRALPARRFAPRCNRRHPRSIPKTVAALPSTSEKGGGGGGGGGGGDEEKMKNAVVAVVSGVVGLLLGSVLKGGRGKKAEPAPAPAAKSRW